MPITITDDAALLAFKAEILKSITPEQREQILSEAVGKLMVLGSTRYGDRSYRDDVMSQALASTMRDTIVALLKEPENQAKLDTAARQVVDAVLGKLTEKVSSELINAVDKALRGY